MRGRKVGMLAFVLHRVTGVGLVVYLFLHLLVLSQLAAGPAAWDAFIDLARGRMFLALDILLGAALVFHGLNGLRLAALGLGLGSLRYRALIRVVLIVSLAATAGLGYLLFAVEG